MNARALARHVALPCQFVDVIPGMQTVDGRAVLPTLVLRLPDEAGVSLLGVVDRHDLIDTRQVGKRGIARLLFMLGTFQVIDPVPQGTLLPEVAGLSRAPAAVGRVAQVLQWDVTRGELPYESLYTAMVIELRVGTIGLRTHASAPNLAARIGRNPVQVGDWLQLSPARIDILGFEVS